MRPYLGSLACLLALSAAPDLLAQQPPPQPPQRDPQALAILRQSLVAMGAGNPRNITDTRSEVLVRSDIEGRATEQAAVWKTLGRKAWRVETQGRDGSGVFIANDGWAISRSGSGQEDFPAVSVGEAGNWRIPFLSILADVEDPELAVKLVETEENNFHRIRLQRRPKDPLLSEVMEPCDVFIDIRTFLPLRLRFSVHPPVNLLADIPAEVEYQGYELMSGLLIPTHVRYSIRGRLVSEFFLTSFTLNAGVSPTDFDAR